MWRITFEDHSVKQNKPNKKKLDQDKKRKANKHEHVALAGKKARSADEEARMEKEHAMDYCASLKFEVVDPATYARQKAAEVATKKHGQNDVLAGKKAEKHVNSHASANFTNLVGHGRDDLDGEFTIEGRNALKKILKPKYLFRL